MTKNNLTLRTFKLPEAVWNQLGEIASHIQESTPGATSEPNRTQALRAAVAEYHQKIFGKNPKKSSRKS